MAIETAFSPEELWNEALENISSEIPNQSFNTWFRSSCGISLDDETFRVSVPNRFTADWLSTKFSDIVSSVVANCLGSSRKIEFLVNSECEIRGAIPQPETAPAIEHKVQASIREYSETHLNQRYTFGSFVVGDSNRFAQAAALAVAESPMQTKYNPLYVYGGVGLGKTHLVQAIGNLVSENYSTLKVLYVTSEKFTNDFIEAIAHHKTSEFSRSYRGVDLLLLDDIQFLTGKEATQEQFFHTFNALYQAGKQIVLTSDRSPREIQGLEERLLSRFQCGLVTDIQPPDLETRIAILNRIVESEKLSISPDIISYIANNITRNIRELEGSIIRLLAYGSFTGKEISASLAHDVLRDAFTNVSIISAGSIIREVCDYFKIAPDQLKSKRKTAGLVRARQIAMYLCRKYTSNSLKAIGEEFGGRDHSTVIHAISSIENGLGIDFNLKSDFDAIERSLKS